MFNNKNNRFEGLGMVKYSKYTPSTNPVGKDGKPWNNSKLYFVLICNRTNSKKLAQEGKQSADFVSCMAQGVTADSISQYFPDGSMIYAYGHLESYAKNDEATGAKTYNMIVKIDDYQASYNLLSKSQIEMLHQKNVEREAQKANANAGNVNVNGMMGTTGYAAPVPNQPAMQPQNTQTVPQNPQVMQTQSAPQSAQTMQYNQGYNPGYNPGYNAPIAGDPGYVGQYGATPVNNSGNGNMNGSIPGYTAPTGPVAGQASATVPNGAPGNMQFGQINESLVISDDDLPF